MTEAIGGTRPRIYQLMVRHFGNTNPTRKPGGTIEDNGCGKFDEIDDTALRSLRELGVTHLWLTGVLEHASLTAYPDRPADPPTIVKGLAGSPYAVRDYFDVSPDCAREPSERLAEFQQLLARCEQHGFKTLMDFVPNHVSRAYGSDVRPELTFGNHDNRGVFFDRDNNFYYLDPGDPGGGPPLRLPVGPGEEEEVFELEREHGRVTGNNQRSWRPTRGDWYETVKLNYGHDYTAGRDTSHLPGPEASLEEVPDTWRKMDAILGYWQEMGVGGFRADMAHIVPMEFWRWAIGRARERDAEAFFMGEAYDGDPAKLVEGDVLEELVASGFDAVYDHETYQHLQAIYEGPKWANDLDWVVPQGRRFRGSVHYAENHDEVRLANPQRWGGVGMEVGKPVTAILFGITSGPTMLYNGQEVGEPAVGAEGFSGDDGRSSIFDYGQLPELAKWVDGHRYDGGGLSAEQSALRQWYGRLLEWCGEPAFVEGEFLPLNPGNLENPKAGRIGDETASGHWFYAFVRSDSRSGQVFLVVANLHRSETMVEVILTIPEDVLSEVAADSGELHFRDRLATAWETTVGIDQLRQHGLALPELPPCSAMYLQVERLA